MRNRFLLAAALFLAADACCLRAAPQPAAAPPVAPGSRELYTFDFEEIAKGNFEATPMFWSKVVGAGFPAYASGRFDHDTFRSKNTSFRLDINGGSAAYEFIAPAGRRIPIDPNADYHIIAFVKTTPLQNARAEIAAWFADEGGHLLAPTEVHSEPFAETAAEGSDAGGWHVVHLFVPGPRAHSPEAAAARSLVLQLGLLQPQQLAGSAARPPSPLGRFELYTQDLKGTAWFDDITVFQLPRVSIEVPQQVTANIFEPGKEITLDMTVSDLAQGTPGAEAPLDVALRITDAGGLLFAGEKWHVASAPNVPWTHHYTHPPLPPGLYTATIDITDKTTGTLIARRATTFLALAAMPVRAQEGSSAERTAPEFGIDAVGWPANAWSELPAVLRDTDVGLVKIAAWRRDMSEEALRQRDPALDALLTMVQRSDIHVIASLAQLPTVLSAKLIPAHPATATDDSLLALADADPVLWRPYIAFLLARYSTMIDRWEFGSTTTPFSGTLNAGAISAEDPYPHLYDAAYGQLGKMLNQPRLIIPWNALFDFNSHFFPHAALDLQIPSVIKPGQIPSYVSDFRTASGADAPSGPTATPGDLYVHIDPLSAQEYSPDERMADFAQRIIYSRSVSPTATLIDLPLSRPAGNSGAAPRTEPDELLLGYRTLVRTLGNSTFRREIPLADGCRGFLFSRDADGILALWSDMAADHEITLDLPLGDNPTATDLAGNVRTLPMDPRTHLAHVTLSTMPLLLQHIDPNLLALRASFGLANAAFPAGAGVIRTDTLLSNPYPDPLSGNMRVELPPGWTVEPSIFPVSIPAGGTFHQPMVFRYPYTESAGPKSIRATLSALNTGGGDTERPLAMTTTAFIRSETVETECFARLLPNGDVMIQQMITNLSGAPLNSQAYALVPGYARQQRFVLNLLPGQTTIKRFLFPLTSNVDYTDKAVPAALAATLASKTASVGLRQTDGKTLITKSVPLN